MAGIRPVSGVSGVISLVNTHRTAETGAWIGKKKNGRKPSVSHEQDFERQFPPPLHVNTDISTRAHLALANRVRELESQLALVKQTQAQDAISPSSHGGSASSPALANTGGLNSEGAVESSADAIATGLFDDQPGNADIGYFGKNDGWTAWERRKEGED